MREKKPTFLPPQGSTVTVFMMVSLFGTATFIARERRNMAVSPSESWIVTVFETVIVTAILIVSEP